MSDPTMKAEAQIRGLREKIQVSVDQAIAIGCPKVPTTQLECHSFELGRLAALKWVAPDPEQLNSHVKDNPK